MKVGSFENIELLMNNVSFNDIICWIILDEKFNSLIRATTEENNPSSRIIALPTGKLNKRTFTAKYLKSYVRFLLSSNKWIPDSSGQIKENPQHCCFEDNGLAPFIIVPNIDNVLYITLTILEVSSSVATFESLFASILPV